MKIRVKIMNAGKYLEKNDRSGGGGGGGGGCVDEKTLNPYHEYKIIALCICRSD